jgi:hypothetical protein
MISRYAQVLDKINSPTRPNDMRKSHPAIVLLFPAVLFAQYPFDGTWKTNLDQSKASPEPIVFSVRDGVYDCDSCAPKVHVKADGSDQPVTGLSHITAAVNEIDSHTIKIVVKKDGETVSEQLRTASEDGRTLHVKVTEYPPRGGKPIIEETTSERVGEPMPGANTTSGNWRTRSLSGSENGLMVTYKESDSELSMSTPTGVSWTAKFDGKYYPVSGSYKVHSVSLRKINDRTIELTFEANGLEVLVNTMTITADGRSMTTVSENRRTGRISTWVATKQ